MIRLRNIDNSCYLNSVLQTFFHNKKFNEILSNNDKEENNSEIIKIYLDIINNRPIDQSISLMKKKISIYNPSLFNNNNQQDAHECLLSMLNIFHESLKYDRITTSIYNNTETLDSFIRKKSEKEWDDTTRILGTSTITDIFYGQIIKTIRCLECNHIFYKFEMFTELSLSIDTDSDSLNTLIEKYIITQTVKGYTCEKCNKIQTCNQHTYVYKWPKILIFHLKRFNNKGEKINNIINIPRKISFKEYDHLFLSIPKKDDIKYSIFSIINHQGNSNNGHYYNYSLKGEEIYNFDDDTIKKVSKICNKDNYILFFEMM